MDNKNLKDEITVAINDWLLQYDKIKEFAEIYTEELPDGVDSLALQRTAVERLPARYIAERFLRREYQYLLLLKLDSEENSQRRKALKWLDDLGKWIEKQKVQKNVPKISGYSCYDLRCSNELSYETDTETKVTTYYIQLYFDLKEVE